MDAIWNITFIMLLTDTLLYTELSIYGNLKTLYSCLENPRDRGAWWAALYGVAQSQTRLKQLNSSSSRESHIQS